MIYGNVLMFKAYEETGDSTPAVVMAGSVLGLILLTCCVRMCRKRKRRIKRSRSHMSGGTHNAGAVIFPLAEGEGVKMKDVGASQLSAYCTRGEAKQVTLGGGGEVEKKPEVLKPEIPRPDSKPCAAVKAQGFNAKRRENRGIAGRGGLGNRVRGR